MHHIKNCLRYFINCKKNIPKNVQQPTSYTPAVSSRTSLKKKITLLYYIEFLQVCVIFYISFFFKPICNALAFKPLINSTFARNVMCTIYIYIICCYNYFLLFLKQPTVYTYVCIYACKQQPTPHGFQYNYL